MKANEISEGLIISVKDFGRDSEGRLSRLRGKIADANLIRENRATKALVLFDIETTPRYVPIARLRLP